MITLTRAGRRRALSAGLTGLVVVVAGALFVMTASASPGSNSSAIDSTVEPPININPDKSPDFEPPLPPAAPTDSIAEQKAAAQALLERALTDFGLIVCLTPEGTLAGILYVDLVDPTVPSTLAEKRATCSNLFPGSHP